MPTPAETPVSEHLRRIPPAVRRTVHVARRVVKSAAPKAMEIAYRSSRYPATMIFGPEGPAWVVDEGKPTRRVVPIRQGGNWTTVVAIADGPTTHEGKQLVRNDPVTIGGLAVDYLGELVYDAEQRFK